MPHEAHANPAIEPPIPHPVSIITGAGSGIGRAASELLSARGHRLVLVGRRLDRLNETGAMLDSEWIATPADVSDATRVKAVVESTLARFGRIDVLINNAGFAPMTAIEHHTPDLIREAFAINAVGPALAIAAVWPTMLRQGAGRIVNVSSFATVDPFPGFFAYAGAKAAVNLLTLAAANEGRSHGIRAFAVAPGAVETEMLRAIISEQTIPRTRTLTPQAVAGVIVQCAVGDRDAESGQTILVPNP